MPVTAVSAWYLDDAGAGADGDTKQKQQGK
jgi:hypothetical protein